MTDKPTSESESGRLADELAALGSGPVHGYEIAEWVERNYDTLLISLRAAAPVVEGLTDEEIASVERVREWWEHSGPRPALQDRTVYHLLRVAETAERALSASQSEVKRMREALGAIAEARSPDGDQTKFADVSQLRDYACAALSQEPSQ